LPLRPSGDADFPVLETENISAGGALCRVDRYLPLMTKLRVQAELPGGDGGFLAEAVVVRIEPSQPWPGEGQYRVALFFQGMEEGDREALLEYLES
jgi:hypothetical protein